MAKSDCEWLAEVLGALRKSLEFSERAAAAHGLRPQEFHALLAIESSPGRSWVTVGELTEQLGIARGGAARLIDRMAALRLVKRVREKTKTRSERVRLTAKGARRLEQLYRVHRDELRCSGPRLAALLQKARRGIAPKIELASPACAMPEIED